MYLLTDLLIDRQTVHYGKCCLWNWNQLNCKWGFFQEVRLTQDPFPLYPGEVVKENVAALKIVMANSALRLRAVLDIEDKDEKRVAGDEWLFEGPGKKLSCERDYSHTYQS